MQDQRAGYYDDNYSPFKKSHRRESDPGLSGDQQGKLQSGMGGGFNLQQSGQQPSSQMGSYANSMGGGGDTGVSQGFQFQDQYPKSDNW